jgi:peptidoglycan/xylan/chitin deacetylase (PgdA/CDA1 family)
LAVEYSASSGVVLYHRVAAPLRDPWDLAVTVDHFDEHLVAMKTTGRIVSLDAEAGRGRVTRLGRHRLRVALTFDDGYVDNIRAALPLLERHDAPATIFIATGFLDRPSFWWDSLEAIALGSGASVEHLALAAQKLGLLAEIDVERIAGATPMALHDELYRRVAALPAADVGHAVESLAAAASLPPPRPDGRPMSTAELVDLASHPLVTIGAHTAHHPRLSRLSPEAVRGEMVAGSKVLDELFGRAPRMFAYPFGDTSPATADAARAVGFKRAFTTEARWMSLFDDPMLLPRMAVPNRDGDEFTRWLTRRGE